MRYFEACVQAIVIVFLLWLILFIVSSCVYADDEPQHRGKPEDYVTIHKFDLKEGLERHRYLAMTEMVQHIFKQCRDKKYFEIKDYIVHCEIKPKGKKL